MNHLRLEARHDLLPVVRRSRTMALVLRRVLALSLVFAVSACGRQAEPPPREPVPVAPSAPERQLIPEAPAGPAASASTLAAAQTPATGDLDAVSARGRLRILVTPSRTYYAIDNNLQRGASYDAGVAFTRFTNARQPSARPIEVIFIPTPEDVLVKNLLAGRGDIAVNLRQTFERDDQVAFATPTRTGIREWIITGTGQKPVVSLEDIGGRVIHVRKSSDHYASLVRLNEQLQTIARPPSRIAFADESLTDEDLLERVNEGTFPATITDDYLFEARQRELTSVAANKDVAVSQDGVIAWVTRKDAPQLLAAINAFFATHRPRP